MNAHPCPGRCTHPQSIVTMKLVHVLLSPWPLTLWLLSPSLFAQPLSYGQNQGITLYNQSLQAYVNTTSLEALAQHQDLYLQPEWRRGSLHLTNDQTFDSLRLRYNLSRHQVEVRQGDSVLVLDQFVLREFRLEDGPRYVNGASFRRGDAFVPDVLEVVHWGQVRLLVHHMIKKTESSYIPQLGSENETHRRSKFEAFYLSTGKQLIPLPANKRKAARLFPGHGKEVLDFARRQKLKFRRRDDLRVIGAYYDSLVSEP